MFDGRGFTVTGAMTSLTGASGEDFASILRSLGYRMDRKPKPAEAKPANRSRRNRRRPRLRRQRRRGRAAATSDVTAPHALNRRSAEVAPRQTHRRAELPSRSLLPNRECGCAGAGSRIVPNLRCCRGRRRRADRSSSVDLAS